MNNIQTNEFIVLAARYRKSNDGKVTTFLQVQNSPSSPIGFVRINTTEPPLPGTRIRATGTIAKTDQGPVMHVATGSDLIPITGQQGLVLHKTLATLLDRFNIKYDSNLLTKNTQAEDLSKIEEKSLIELLSRSGVKDADSVVRERTEVFASTLTRNLFTALEAIRIPFDVDRKREMPFTKDTWPAKALLACMPHFIEVTQGQRNHAAMPNNRNFYLTNHLKYDGIDNFFRAIAIASMDSSIFGKWMSDSLRPATLTKCYVEEKQKQGTQIFTGSDIKQLERLGINSPSKIAARLGNMIQLTLSGTQGINLIPQGTYQSSTSLASLEKLSLDKDPLNVPINDQGLDPFQKKALMAFMDGAPLTLISGPPGTGKSTLISKMIEHASAANEKIIVLTPTGKSSERLNESFNKQFTEVNKPMSITAHSLFYGTLAGRKVSRSAPLLNSSTLRDALDSEATEMFPVNVDRILRFASYKDGKNEVSKPEESFYSDTAPAEILRDATVFIDESTQITGDMAALIMEMRPKRLIMTGDLSQLKPVGAGKPFHDLITLAKTQHLGERVNFVELKIDHRATKELSDFTKKLRDGEIPLDYVEEFNGNPDTTAKELLGREAAVIECKKLNDVIDIVEQLIHRSVHEQNSIFSIVENDSMAIVPGSTPVITSVKMTPDLSAQVIVCPSVMTMAYTNAEVHELNAAVASILRPQMKTGKGMPEVPALAILSANGIALGDVILQTENAKTTLLYTTPQGNFKSATTMNGEALIFIGANTWLPLPKSNPSNEIEKQLLMLWGKSGALQDALTVVSNTQHDDPTAHLELLRLLHLKLNGPLGEAAKQLISIGLTEVLTVSQSHMRAGASIEIGSEKIKRLIIPPTLPKEKDNTWIEQYEQLLRNIWRIDVAFINTKPGRAGLIELSDYRNAYDKIINGFETLTLGNAYTVHKAQGSQAKIAISVVSPPQREEEATNHEASVYTATTRAEQSSYILTHGTNAIALNKCWAATREIEAKRQSPVILIAKGHIPPMAATHVQTTCIPPQRRQEELSVLNTNYDDAAVKRFHTKVTLSAHDLPSTLKLSKSPKYLIHKMAMQDHNDIADIGHGIPNIPNMLSAVRHVPINPSHPIKKEFQWERSLHPANIETQNLNEQTQLFTGSLTDALSNISLDFN